MKLAMIAASLVLIGSAQAQTAREAYDLQEKCGRRATEVWIKEYNNKSIHDNYVTRYQNHYSLRFNKCFFLEINYGLGDFVGKKLFRLFDINEDTCYGSYIEGFGPLDMCEMEEKQCKSEEEWRALIKPFMED